MKILNILSNIIVAFYLVEVIILWPIIVFLVWASEITMGYSGYTLKEANSYTWKRWNDIRKEKRL